ncbi:hypothetical protein BofuT4_uP062390.1 [Botrytis cinerea T4]|uniref:Uncharacterized protein n=1 Tax=Botryotinia fuckeliana (strain T4) TaxID=999810 RepID=G2XTH3_BOTF4|nr:hypothetical protein BofuT4_uP062390.1 [Botrytis cinerea T4]
MADSSINSLTMASTNDADLRRCSDKTRGHSKYSILPSIVCVKTKSFIDRVRIARKEAED